MKSLNASRNARAIVLTGEGKAFCSGQDLGDLKTKYVPGHVPHLGDDLKKRYEALGIDPENPTGPVFADGRFKDVKAIGWVAVSGSWRPFLWRVYLSVAVVR